MPKVLVLGGSGFIGNHVVRELLKRHYDVRVLVRPSSDLKLFGDLPSVELFTGDLEDTDSLSKALEGVDSLIHTAAYYPVYSLDKTSQVSRAKKQIDTIHSALKNSNCKKFVYVSTLTAVGHYPDGQPEDENAPFPGNRYKSTYASLKRAMQDEVLNRTEDFNSIVVAPTAVFGPGDIKPTTGRVIVETAKNHFPFALAGRTNVVDVRLVAKGTVRALEKGKIGRLYVLGGENMTAFEMIKRIAVVAGAFKPILALPILPLLPLAWLSELIGKRQGLQTPAIPVVGLDLSRFSDHYSSEVAKRELNYDPLEISYEKSIEDSLNWFREMGYL